MPGLLHFAKGRWRYLEAPVLQIIRSKRDNLGIISIFAQKNIFCDPSLELSRRDGSIEGSHHMFSLRNKKNYL